MTYIFIKWSDTFWEVRPPTKAGMRALLDYIRMCWKSRGTNKT